MPRPSSYSPADKAAIVNTARQQLRIGVSRQAIADNLGIKLASLNGWLREQTINSLYPPLPPTMPRNRAAY